jgi:hypothetical protein
MNLFHHQSTLYSLWYVLSQLGWTQHLPSPNYLITDGNYNQQGKIIALLNGHEERHRQDTLQEACQRDIPSRRPISLSLLFRCPTVIYGASTPWCQQSGSGMKWRVQVEGTGDKEGVCWLLYPRRPRGATPNIRMRSLVTNNCALLYIPGVANPRPA